ncbi:MAG: OmpA family protein [Candidatus Kapabacteria bacterium]|nr:OmpA family protein [Candidatus Kapabacteria bacterium]
MKLYLQILVLFVCFSLKSFSEINVRIDSSDYRIGAHTGAFYSINESNIPRIWSSPQCGIFKNDVSFGYNAGIDFSLTIFSDILWSDLRLNYKQLPIKLSIITNDYQVYNPESNSYVPMTIKSEFNSILKYLIFEPGIILQPIQSIPIKFRFSFDAGLFIFGKAYETTEEILSPRIYTFPDTTLKHITQKGDLRTSQNNFGLISGVFYEYKIFNNAFLSAEINYRHQLHSALADYNLKSKMIGFNLGIQYGFDSGKEPPLPELVNIDTLKHDTVVSVKVADLPKKEIIKPDVILSVSSLNVLETIVTHTYPILPYIFFDSSSSKLKDKYIQTPKNKTAQNEVPNSALNIYHSMLDIIGSRMKENPGSRLMITGMTDGAEEASPVQLLNLASKRAQVIAEYLTSNWSIEKGRLEVKTRVTPELSTSTIYYEGYEENRRVELYSSNFEILKPIIYSKFKEYEISSDSIVISSKIINFEKLSGYEINLSADGNIFFNRSFMTNDSLFIFKFNAEQKEKIAKGLNEKKKFTINYTYMSDSSRVEKSLPIDFQLTKNKFELGRLNLIIFDFDKFEINEMNKKMINDFVANTIMDNSTVSIIGSTDKLGKPEYNMNLSEGRAESAFKVIKKIKPNADFKEVKGIGNSMLLYDNSIPEGRFYSRTVLIKVTTPIK